jgi:hypothetical protein
LRCKREDGSLDWLEDGALHPVAVVGPRPSVKAVDIMVMRHQASIVIFLLPTKAKRALRHSNLTCGSLDTHLLGPPNGSHPHPNAV